MKTVQDYLDLGLVFVTGDIVDDDGENDGTKFKPLSYWMVEHCNAGEYEYSNAKVESFAWRNNDGVKPEYNGLIHAMFENGSIIQDVADSLSWGGSFNPIIQWRPVVLQSDDEKDNKDESFKLPIGIDSPELRGAFKSLKEHLENKPPFWNKSIKTINCPCVSVNIKAVKPILSPKEDKPMKPVYTAEMHARNELPPIGSMVLVDVEAESGVKYKDHPTILADVSGELPQLKVMAILTSDVGRRVAVLQNKNNECHCFKLSSVRPIKPIIKTIKVNDFDVPAPMSEAPMFNSVYFTPQTGYEVFYCKNSWIGDKFDSRFLSRGLVHSTKSAAIAHAKAMLGIDPNESN